MTASPPDHPPQPHQQYGMGRLLFCAAGICICFLYYGILQERLFGGRHHKLSPSFVLLTQCCSNTVVAWVWQKLQQQLIASSVSHNNNNKSVDTAVANNASKATTKQQLLPLPHVSIFAAAICYLVAMLSSNEAIPLVSFPVAVLCKSCKLIPTMIVGQLVALFGGDSKGNGDGYQPVEWMAALCISAGIVLFQWSRQQQQQSSNSNGSDAKNDSNNEHSNYGMALLLLSLTMDGILSACQNWIKRCDPSRHKAPNAVQTMLWVNLYATIVLSGSLMVVMTTTNGADNSSRVMAEWGVLRADSHLMTSLAILNVTAAIGQIFIFLTLTWYTPVITTTITTTRKFVTILLSVWTFGHSFTPLQWISIGLVFAGLYLIISFQQRQQQGRRPIEDKAKRE